uniref:Uncharacterized protein n=1 Tax=Cuerna arida TaxID=1464854 RepID=A0A1B6EJT4_9HEMI
MWSLCVIVIALLSLNQEVLCFLNFLPSNNSVIPNSNAKDFEMSEFNDYIKKMLSEEQQFDGNSLVHFPKSLKNDKYTLTDGNVERYRDPKKAYGFYDKVLFHQDKDEFYGVLQIHSPAVEFSYKYESRIDGTPGTGKISMLVSHSPLQLQMDFGQKKDNLCLIDQSKNSLQYFFGKGLIVKPTVEPDSPDGNAAGERLVEELKSTWVPKLFQILVKIKTHVIMNNLKKEMALKPRNVVGLNRICEHIK